MLPDYRPRGPLRSRQVASRGGRDSGARPDADPGAHSGACPAPGPGTSAFSSGPGSHPNACPSARRSARPGARSGARPGARCRCCDSSTCPTRRRRRCTNAAAWDWRASDRRTHDEGRCRAWSGPPRQRWPGGGDKAEGDAPGRATPSQARETTPRRGRCGLGGQRRGVLQLQRLRHAHSQRSERYHAHSLARGMRGTKRSGVARLLRLPPSRFLAQRRSYFSLGRLAVVYRRR